MYLSLLHFCTDLPHFFHARASLRKFLVLFCIFLVLWQRFCPLPFNLLLLTLPLFFLAVPEHRLHVRELLNVPQLFLQTFPLLIQLFLAVNSSSTSILQSYSRPLTSSSRRLSLRLGALLHYLLLPEQLHLCTQLLLLLILGRPLLFPTTRRR